MVEYWFDIELNSLRCPIIAYNEVIVYINVHTITLQTASPTAKIHDATATESEEGEQVK